MITTLHTAAGTSAAGNNFEIKGKEFTFHPHPEGGWVVKAHPGFFEVLATWWPMSPGAARIWAEDEAKRWLDSSAQAVETVIRKFEEEDRESLEALRLEILAEPAPGTRAIRAAAELGDGSFAGALAEYDRRTRL